MSKTNTTAAASKAADKPKTREWEDKIHRLKVDRGLSRSEATKRLVATEPALHRSMLEEWNTGTAQRAIIARQFGDEPAKK